MVVTNIRKSMVERLNPAPIRAYCCCVFGQDTSALCMNESENGAFGRWCEMAATSLSVCPRESVAAKGVYHHLCDSVIE